MAKKKKRKVLKPAFRFLEHFVVFGTACRVLLVVLIFGVITVALCYNCFTNIMKIQKLKNEKNNLEEELISLKEEKEILETDILRLEDSEYIAKYVREKYFYSKDGELILRLD